jgi:16S rRNA A1518/A1519 N6-dimethyltransferase RsmA/KsgA/DIM1 with predicted DNA glycosylase/AP lyase activity
LSANGAPLSRPAPAPPPPPLCPDKKNNTKNPPRSLGQNFLTDEATLARIVRASGVAPGDLVLEVGPGTGNLTRHLVGAGARVTAVEKDDALAERLPEAVPGLAALVRGDVLRVGLRGVVAGMMRGAGGGGAGAAAAVKIVANLPYNITKEFLLAALPLGGPGGARAAAAGAADGDGDGDGDDNELGSGVSEVTLMLEEDAARRLSDPKPGRPDYRAMSVLVHRWSRPQYLFRIPRDRYYPQPGVDGAMVRFRLVAPRDRPPLPFPRAGDAAERAHAALINAAFSERRKMMRNVLTSGLGRGGRAWGAPTRDPAVVAAALVDAGARDEARPQELSPAQFAAFHCALARRAAEARGAAGGGGGGDEDDDVDDAVARARDE